MKLKFRFGHFTGIEVAGGGIEYSLGQWSAKLEYLYVDLGTATCNAAACLLPADAMVDVTANIFRAGLNYRF